MIQEIDQDCEQIVFGPIESSSNLNGMMFTNATKFVFTACYSREFNFEFWYLVFTCLGWPTLLVLVIAGVLAGIYFTPKIYHSCQIDYLCQLHSGGNTIKSYTFVCLMRNVKMSFLLRTEQIYPDPLRSPCENAFVKIKKLIKIAFIAHPVPGAR